MNRKKSLDDQARSSISGSFIKLSKGIVHYELAGPDSGETVVMVCGLVTPLFGWDRTFRALTEAGYRVLRYNHYGRGYSDRPDLQYTPEVFVQQLHELMSALKLDDSATLIGWSMGGAISMHYAKQYPEKVKRLILIAPAGFLPGRPSALKILSLPGIGKFIMNTLGEKITLKALRGHFSDPDAFPDYYKRAKIQMDYKGFTEALLSTMLNFPFHELHQVADMVGKNPRPVLLIWGKEDEITPYDGAAKLKELVPQLELMDIADAKHAVHYEYHKEVNEKIISFLIKSS